MNRMRKAIAVGTLVAVGIWASGCSQEESNGHDANLGGVLHRDGYQDPASAGCPACHGADLRGSAGPSCYSCHETVNI